MELFSIHLIDFLDLGELGPIRFGLPSVEVERLLGQPDGKGTFKIHKGYRGEIWRYESLQITLLPDKGVDMIGLYTNTFDDDPITLPPSLVMEGITLSRAVTLDQFTAYLDEQGLPYRIDPMLTFETQTNLIVGRGTSVLFNEIEQLAKMLASKTRNSQG